LRGKNVDPKIRRRLEFGEVLQKQITEAMKTRSWKVKKVFHPFFSGSLVKHYKMQRYVHGMLSKKCLRKAKRPKIKILLSVPEQLNRSMSPILSN